MAHFAKVRNGIVVEVIVATQDYIDTMTDTTPGQWIQTSYNTRGGIYYEPNSHTPAPDQSKALRKNYAGIGYVYDPVRDAFYLPQPYPSWILNDFSCFWEPPVPCPEDGNDWEWDESTLSWKLVSVNKG